MKILVIGSGAREHALIWKIAKSNKVSKIYCTPGNGGISQLAQCVNIKAEDIETLLNFALKEDIDLTVVGPEAPLVDGIVDRFTEEGLKIFGPNKKAAQLEGSKTFSKEFMEKHDIPTAKYGSYNKVDEAIEGLKDFIYPLVIKADGLAAGKGVVICEDYNQAEETISDMMTNKKFGESGSNIVIEEFLEGTEVSLLCFVSGNKIIPMESARDYKQAFDNNEGPNTGGMGCFSPNPIFTDDLLKDIEEKILSRVEQGLKEENLDYNGVLFIGFMITKEGAKILEFNVRMGDPETEVVLPRLENDMVEVMEQTINGSLEKSSLKWSPKACICIIAASGGYPTKYEKNKKITGLKDISNDTIVFHGGTKKINNELYTNGGRVLAVTSLGNTLENAREKVYKEINKINFEKMFYRKDIGKI